MCSLKRRQEVVGNNEILFFCHIDLEVSLPRILNKLCIYYFYGSYIF